jgi:hypothetical protein
MVSKEQIYTLDDIGFVGTQKKRTKAQMKKDIEDTVKYIKAQKAEKLNTRVSKNKKKAK